MNEVQKSARRFPIRLTHAQRKVVAEMFPDQVPRLRLDEPNQRVVSFTLDELNEIHRNAKNSVRHAGSGMKRTSLRHVVDLAEQGIENSQGIGAIPAKERLYQFRITLKDIMPRIWRRIQIKGCSLDKLHECIQTAMGWSNSHLHHFRIDGHLYGDRWLIDENFAEFGYQDSRFTMLEKVMPRSGERFWFEYEYDFGDCWQHEVLFEGCLRADPGQRYPVCLEGERACPPEDVGGTTGYQEFLEAITDPDDEQHDEFLRWSGFSFDPENFDSVKATKSIRRGLPDWRKMALTHRDGEDGGIFG